MASRFLSGFRFESSSTATGGQFGSAVARMPVASLDESWTGSIVADERAAMSDRGGLATADGAAPLALVQPVAPDPQITVNGTAGNDVLTGSEDDDTISSFAGDDVINGFGGNDLIDGGAGNDLINGGSGDDRIIGGAGNDILVGGGGFEQMNGGLGDDSYYVDGADFVFELPGQGFDTVYVNGFFYSNPDARLQTQSAG